MSDETNRSGGEKRVTLDVALVRLDGGTQIRAKTQRNVIKEYVERMESGEIFPPLMVVYDGERYWLADGFHRLHALLRMKRTTVECLVFEGTVRDARLMALKANSAHGLRRSNADKRRAVEIVLADDEWSQKSTRWIADVCGVGRELVETMRRESTEEKTHPNERVADSTTHLQEADSSSGVRIGQDGRLYAAHRATAPLSAADGADAVGLALAAGEVFDGCLVRLKKLSSDGEILADGPGGAYLLGVRLEEFQICLRQAADLLAAARPVSRCSHCDGGGCQRCHRTGWLCPAALRS